ncbi:MAG: hypothetical protein IPG64_19360 [Haliea sp.]|nr:hypothetical protein [Haliea sp.]
MRPEPSEAEHIQQALAYQVESDLTSAIVELQDAVGAAQQHRWRWLLSEFFLLQRNGANALAQLERAQEPVLSGRDFNDRWVSAIPSGIASLTRRWRVSRLCRPQRRMSPC